MAHSTSRQRHDRHHSKDIQARVSTAPARLLGTSNADPTTATDIPSEVAGLP